MWHDYVINKCTVTDNTPLLICEKTMYYGINLAQSQLYDMRDILQDTLQLKLNFVSLVVHQRIYCGYHDEKVEEYISVQWTVSQIVSHW